MKHIFEFSEYTAQKMYHVSHYINRESITKNGLDATKGASPWPEDEYPKGTYLWTTVKDARKYGFGNGDPFDIWEVNITGLAIKKDPITKEAFYVSEIIEPNKLKLLEKHEDDVTNPVVYEWYNVDTGEFINPHINKTPYGYGGNYTKEFLLNLQKAKINED